MVLLFVEYFGIDSHIPIINALHLELVLSAMMFIYILVKEDIREVVSSTQSKLFVCFILFTAVSALYAFVMLELKFCC